MINHVFTLLGKDSKRSLEKYLEGKEDEMLEGFNASDLTLGSTMIFKMEKYQRDINF